MSIAAAESLVGRIEQGATALNLADALVPVEDTVTFLLVVREIVSSLHEKAGDDLVLLVDAKTAQQVSAIGKLRPLATHVHVFGSVPSGWNEVRDANTHLHDALPGDEQFFLAVSGTASFAVVVAATRKQEQSGYWSKGGWSGLRPLVRQIYEHVVDTSTSDFSSFPFPKAKETDPDVVVRVSLRLMTALIQHYTSRERDVIRSKSDLSSVLEILKTISANRRAHDVLYAFVNQIAQVISIDRCSVVRVWGDEGQGHVLASHEDESITDLLIDLSKYPEIRQAIDSKDKVLINNAPEHPLTKPHAEVLRKAGIQAILVIPIVLFDENVGSFFLRAVRKRGTLTLREVSFCEIVAEAAANALERAHLFDSIQRANKRLELLAITDGLTGLYNRRYFRERLDQEFARSARYEQPLACMIIDIDNFKQVNDTYGHQIGDEVLRAVADYTKNACRKSDIVARFGGEELVIIMPLTPPEGAKGQAIRLLQGFRELRPPGLPPERVITASIGVAMLDRGAMPDAESLVRLADEAMYLAKRRGKNRVVVDGKELQE